MNETEVKIENLQRQMRIASDRISKLETCIKIADDNEPCTPAPPPISEETLREHKEALYKANTEINRLRNERDAFKFESDNQAAAWKEIHTFIPDVPGLSMVDMVRKYVSELRTELNDLKANNRYQKGYGDGYAFAVDDARKKLAELPKRG